MQIKRDCCEKNIIPAIYIHHIFLLLPVLKYQNTKVVLCEMEKYVACSHFRGGFCDLKTYRRRTVM